jgi:hypothetical protein
MVFTVLLLMFIIQTQPGIPQHVAGHPHAVMSENGCSTAFNTAPNRNTERDSKVTSAMHYFNKNTYI